MKLIKPVEFPKKNVPTPPEMECLGIGLTDLNINFKKGFIEFTTGYKKVDKPRDPKLCEKFISALTEGPRQAKDNVNNLFGGKSAKDFLTEKTKEFEKNYEAAQRTLSNSADAEAEKEQEDVVEQIIEEEL